MDIFHEYKGLIYREEKEVYPVREDTLMLVSAIEHFLGGRPGYFLDVGCGTGMASLLASSRGWKVVSIDREPRALSLLRRNLDLNGLKAEIYLSDLFEGVPNRFRNRIDLAVFNPPYLEIIDEMADRRVELPLQGLDGGQATVHRFLLDLGEYLSENGRCLLLSCREWKLSEVVGRSGMKIEEGNRWERDIYGESFEVLMIARKD